jgi:3',5'-nucleoside bisphosphate phosphatase
VSRAAAAGVELLALTDHDTVAGVAEAIEAGAGAGIGVVPAAELSAVHAQYEDLHVCGYGIDHEHPRLLERLHGARAERERRAERMGERLTELGWAIDDAPLQKRRDEGATIGRPHLAQAVIGHSDNAGRLAEEDVGDVSSFIPAYLIPGAPAYLPREHPTVSEAIAWIHDAGGVAVWAHPFWDVDDPATVLAALDAFRAEGLDGVEAFYVTHDREQTLLLADAAAERGLLTTGSSDFHGPEHRLFKRFLAYELHGREPVLGPIAATAD